MSSDEKPSESQRLRQLPPNLLLREAGQLLQRDVRMVGWVEKLMPLTAHLEALGIDTTPSEKAERFCHLADAVHTILWKIDHPHLDQIEIPVCLSENFDGCAGLLKLLNDRAAWNEKGIDSVATQMKEAAVLIRTGHEHAGQRTRLIDRKSFVTTLTLLESAFREAAKRFEPEVARQRTPKVLN